MTERVYRIHLTESQHATVLQALDFYAEEGIRESGSDAEHAMIDGTFRAIINGLIEAV
jgi:hypothetical protein